VDGARSSRPSTPSSFAPNLRPCLGRCSPRLQPQVPQTRQAIGGERIQQELDAVLRSITFALWSCTSSTNPCVSPTPVVLTYPGCPLWPRSVVGPSSGELALACAGRHAPSPTSRPSARSGSSARHSSRVGSRGVGGAKRSRRGRCRRRRLGSRGCCASWEAR
jgi:hypothetical protein